MAWYSKIKNIFTKKIDKQLEVDKMGGYYPIDSSGALSIAGQKDKLFHVFESCGVDYDNLNPYTQMKLSRMMDSIFPFVKRAINDTSAMVGNIEISGDISDDEKKALNALIKDLPILSEFDWINPHEYGFNNIVTRISRTILRDGMCFVESRTNPESNKYVGELIYNSENFSFERYNLAPYRLTYQANQFPDLESGEFKSIGYRFTNEHPWASPLVAGGGFFTHILISMLVAIKNINMRKGAPVELGIITVKNDESIGNNPSRALEFKNAINSLSLELEEATKAQLNGTPVTIVGKMPIEVDLLTKAFGAEMITEVDHNVLSLILVQVMNLLDVPPDLFGVVLGTTGFSGERFKVLYKIWSSKIDDLREKIRPVAKNILKNYLEKMGVDSRLIQRTEINFVNTQILDDKEIEETGKIRAEKEKIQIESAGMLSERDTKNGDEYLMERNLLQ